MSEGDVQPPGASMVVAEAHNIGKWDKNSPIGENITSDHGTQIHTMFLNKCLSESKQDLNPLLAIPDAQQ